MIRFGSFYSGVGGADLGLEHLGWRCAWQVESDVYRRRVLAAHFPGSEIHVDVGVARPRLVDVVYGELPETDEAHVAAALAMISFVRPDAVLLELSPGAAHEAAT